MQDTQNVENEFKRFFIQRLTQIIYAQNISMIELSEGIGKCSDYISKVLSGRFSPSQEAIFQICNYLNITVQEFYTIDENHLYLYSELLPKLKKLDDNNLVLLSQLTDAILKGTENA